MTLAHRTRAGFETLQLNNSQASVEVCPARGALVTDFRIGTEPLLFLDPATFADASKSVRGGIPLLFPIAGPAPERSPLSQHGFARTSAWATAAASDAEIVLRLAASDSTREKFPYDFQLEYRLTLEGATLQLEWTVRAGERPLPLQFGLHPYFGVPLEAKAAARVDTRASRAWNNITHAFEPVNASPSFGGDEVDLHLLDHATSETILHRGTLSSIRLRWSESFRTLVLWTQPGKPFVCVEPWSAPSLPARGGAPLPVLNAHETATYALGISLGGC